HPRRAGLLRRPGRTGWLFLLLPLGFRDGGQARRTVPRRGPPRRRLDLPGQFGARGVRHDDGTRAPAGAGRGRWRLRLLSDEPRRALLDGHGVAAAPGNRGIRPVLMAALRVADALRRHRRTAHRPRRGDERSAGRLDQPGPLVHCGRRNPGQPRRTRVHHRPAQHVRPAHRQQRADCGRHPEGRDGVPGERLQGDEPMTTYPGCWHAVVDFLEAAGADTVFGLPADDLVLLAAMQTSDLRLVLCRDQRNAAFMATGYALQSGRPGVCVIGKGPASTNVLTGVLEASCSRVPLVVLAAGTAAERRGSAAFQELDQLAFVRPLVKWAHRVDHPGRVVPAIQQAWAIASGGVPGPVYLE